MKSDPSSESVGGAVGAFSAGWDSLSRALWEALTSDVSAEVLVVSPQGRVVLASAEAEAFYGVGAGELSGTPHRDLFPEAVAAERSGYITEVLRTGRPVVLEGVIRGAWRRTSFRPISIPEPHVLVTSRASSMAGASAEAGKIQPAAEGRGERIRARHDDMGPLGALTTREREILALIGRGLSTAEIAQHLARSVKTIEWHRVSLGNKLGVTNRVELAHIALRAGLAMIEVPGAGIGAGASSAGRSDAAKLTRKPASGGSRTA